MSEQLETEAIEVLEEIRASEYFDSVSAELLRAVHDIEQEKQFEDERGSVRAVLRNLINEAVKEPS